MYEPNTPQAEAALAVIAAAFNRPQVADFLKVHNRALNLWRDRPKMVNTIRVYCDYGLNGPRYRTMTSQDFTDAFTSLRLLTGYTYRVYIRYTRNGARRRFHSVVIMDADDLSAPAGLTEKVGEFSL